MEEAWPVHTPASGGSSTVSDDGEEGSGRRPGRRRFSFGVLGRKIASSMSGMANTVAQTAAAAGELITDKELRAKAVSQAARGGPAPAARPPPLRAAA